MKHLLLTAMVAVVGVSAASANVLDLNYSVTPNGGLYDYSFTLSVDPGTTIGGGQGWSWITFGDEVSSASPFADFVLTSSNPGPFSGGLSFSYGYHNGPTWLNNSTNNIVYWTPTSMSDTLTWTGTSASYLPQGQLLYSELIGNGGAPTDNWAVATQQAVPAPSGIIALTIGLAGLAFMKFRAR